MARDEKGSLRRGQNFDFNFNFDVLETMTNGMVLQKQHLKSTHEIWPF
jgi:hypothetical protein